MSSDTTAIRAVGLGKCYHVYAAPSDRLKQFTLPRLRRILGRAPRQYYREFWALESVSFEVRKGETVGIIGRNGAGKSTLLQILCGTLSPTVGSVETSGRVAALLELGAGFNPDYTGRENVYMNCSVLGLSRAEIDERFDRIVAFSEIGEFIEQPVKSYSSGMFARLAFSAAIHVEPEILVVDEALSVGDFAFQYKCMRRLKELSAAGCTVLFVTHDVEQVQKLCQRALYLRRGKAVYFGEARQACERYLADARVAQDRHTGLELQQGNEAHAPSAEAFLQFSRRVEKFRRGDRRQGEILHVSVNGMDLTEPSIRFGERIEVRVTFMLKAAMEVPTIAVYVTDETGQLIIGTNTGNEGIDLRQCPPGELHVLTLAFGNGLREGKFALQVFLADVVTSAQTFYVDYLDFAVPFRSVAAGSVARWAWFSPAFDARLEGAH
jgi:lipopolysaccharide transport system ATP-binding protein